jgi:hypothetical protein
VVLALVVIGVLEEPVRRARAELLDADPGLCRARLGIAGSDSGREDERERCDHDRRQPQTHPTLEKRRKHRSSPSLIERCASRGPEASP